MKEFFFDTANVDYIRSAWKKLEGKVDPKLVRGITTNPNAFFKLNKLSLNEWLDTLPELCKVVSEIRGDDKGVVYVQGPNSNMTPVQQMKYANLVSNYSDGQTKIGLKIPPYHEILEIVEDLNEIVDTNVTGVSDVCTALKCLSYPLNFMSIIPGRMEEAGIDAQAQIAFMNQRNMKLEKREIITGSMRTLEGLTWVFQIGTVPTIGERVWNLIFEGDNLDKILNIDYSLGWKNKHFSPEITNVNNKLSEDFFVQMDECGKVAYADFLKWNHGKISE